MKNSRDSRNLVVHIITGLENAGAEGALYRLTTSDQRCRHHVISLQGDGKYGPLLRKAGISVECMNVTPFNAPFKLLRLATRLKSLRPTVVQTWMFEADLFGGKAARMAGIKNIHWSLRFSNVDLNKVPKWMAQSIKASPKHSFTIPQSIICCGERVRDDYITQGYCPEKMKVVHNGFDMERLRFSEIKRKTLRAKLGIPQDAIVIGMVARNDPQKDYPTLVEALGQLAEHHDFHVILTGDRVNTDCVLRGQIELLDLRDRTHLDGPTADVSEIFSALDIHVLASRFGEGFPNVVAEAMACGAISVASDSGDAFAIVHDPSMIAPIGDANGLYRVLDKLLYDRENWPSRQEMRDRIAHNFDITRMITGFHEAWSIK